MNIMNTPQDLVSPYNIPEEYIKQVDIKIHSMIK